MKKWRPIVFINEETGEILPRDFKEKYYTKTISEWTEHEYSNGDQIINTFKLIKIYGRKEKQLDLF